VNGDAALPQPGTTSAIFETDVRVRFHEVDFLGHVNNAAYLNYLEQAAIDHATFVGLDLERLQQFGGLFIARRHDITFLRPAFAGDVLRVVTWLSEPRGARVDRHYRIYPEPEPTRPAGLFGSLVQARNLPEELLSVRATTEWVFVDDRGRPRRIPAEIAAMFRAEAGMTGAK
jgi:acyl-CoA thioester hydrolase